MIGKLTAMLAAAAPEVTPEDLKTARTAAQGLQFSDLLLIIAVALLLLTALVCWAIFIRKPGAGEKHTYKSRPTIQETEDGRIRKRKKHKRLRREHRQRNPTLSEAGGLPPIRPSGSPPPI
jgi:hypothetical protein